MKKKKISIKVTVSYEPVSKEEEEWRLQKLCELLLRADARVIEELKRTKSLPSSKAI